MLEPLVVKATRAVPRRERGSNPPDLSNYCLGVPTEEEAKVPEANVIEVYNVLIKFLIKTKHDFHLK